MSVGTTFFNLRRAIWRSVALLAVLLVVYVIAGRQLAPMVERTVPALESYLSGLLEQPVTIDEIQGQWRGFGPAFTIRGFSVGDGFELSSVTLEPALLTSLVKQNVIFSRFQVHGGQVDVVQDGDRWRVPAFAILERDVQLREVFVTAYNQLLEQDAIRLRDLNLSLIGDDAVLDLLLADALIIGTHEYHEVSGDLVIDPAGQRVTAGLQIEARDTRYNPDVHAYLRHDSLDLSDFLGFLPEISGFDPNRLELAANWWLRWQDGGVESLRTELQQASMRFHAPNSDVEQSLEDLTAALHWQPGADGQQLIRLRDIGFRYNDQTWLPSSHDIRLSDQDLTVETNQLSVATVGAMVEPWLPVPVFSRHGIRGQVNDLAVHIPRHEGAWMLEALHASGLIRNGEFGAEGHIPGFDQVNARFSAGLRQGVVEIEPGPLQVNLPNSLPEPILMDVHEGAVAWHLSDELKLQIASSEVDFDWRDSGRSRGRFAFAGALDADGDAIAEPVFSLALGGDQLHTDSLQSGLPILLPEPILEWMHTRLHDVESDQWALALPNILAAELDTRIGRMGARVNAATIEIDEDWPAFERVGGYFYLDHRGIDSSLDTGAYAGMQLDQGRLRLPFTDSGDTAVQVSGYAEGLGSQGWSLLTETPLRDLVPPEILGWHVAGQVGGDVDLRIPLHDAPVDLELAMTLHNGLLRMPAQDLQFTEINGPLFMSTQRGLRSPGLQARLFDAPLAAAVQTDVLASGEWRLRFPGQGVMPLAELGAWLQDPWLSSQAARVEYSGELVAEAGRLDLQARSDLRGLPLELPAPFAKAAGESRPFDLSLNLRPEQNQVQARLGDQGWLDLTTDGDWHPTAGRLALGTLETHDPPADHLRLELQLADADLEAWQDTLETFQLLYAESGPLAFRTPADGIVADSSVGDAGPPEPLSLEGRAAELLVPSGLRALLQQLDQYRLHDINLAVESLYQGEQVLEGGTLALQRRVDSWQAQADARRFSIKASLPDNPSEPGLLVFDHLHLGDPDHVSLPAAVADAVLLTDEPLMAEDVRREREPYTYDPELDWLTALDPAWLPYLEVTISDLTHNAESYGEWSFALTPYTEGMRVDRITGAARGVSLNGHLDWQAPDEGWHRTRMNLRASAGDLGTVLQNSGLTPVISSERAQGSAEVEWWGSPLAFDGRGLRGQVGFDLREGNLRELDDFDAIRVIGLLNVTRILRRLSLDFRDVFSAGISYDRIRGDLRVDEGMVSVGDRLSLDGSGARMFFGGDYDMLRDELDAEGVIIARVSNTAGLLALGAGFSPPVALMVIFGERAFERELERLFSVRTEITGPLARPDVRANRLFDSDIRGNEATLEERMRELFGPDAR